MGVIMDKEGGGHLARLRTLDLCGVLRTQRRMLSGEPGPTTADTRERGIALTPTLPPPADAGFLLAYRERGKEKRLVWDAHVVKSVVHDCER